MLRTHFSNQQLEELSRSINPQESSGLNYYPLVKPGERFPVYDPKMEPRLEPRPGMSVTAGVVLVYVCEMAVLL